MISAKLTEVNRCTPCTPGCLAAATSAEARGASISGCCRYASFKDAARNLTVLVKTWGAAGVDVKLHLGDVNN